MKKSVILTTFLFLALAAGAQDFETEIALINVPDFNGKTLAKAPAGKSQTLQLARTKFSKPMESYTTLALPHWVGTTPTLRFQRVYLPCMTGNGH